MNTRFRLIAFSTSIALAVSAHAQLTYQNADASLGTVSVTLSGASSGIGAAAVNANTAIQTFSGFSSLSSVSWSLTDGGSGLPATFNAYVAQWDVANSSIVSGSLTTFGTQDLVFSPGNGATGVLTFNGSWTAANPSQTYALLLSQTSASPFGNFVANVGTIPGGANADFFGTGTAGFAATSALSGSFVSTLETAGSGTLFSPSAYTMSVTGSLAPVPEPKTAAAAIAALFVAVLIGRRTWQRRKLVPIPVRA